MTYSLLLILQAAILLGVTSGVVGTFTLLRQQSLLGDTLSHAALPGIVTMFLCTYSKNPWVLLIGGIISGIVSLLCMNYLIVHTKLKKDAILGILLSVFFGLGLVLLTVAQKIPVSNQAILNKFLFGTISTVLVQDIECIAIIAGFIFFIVILFWKECSMYVFDNAFARASGFNLSLLEAILTLLLILTISIGLQTVGVVLMSTMLIAPAAAARQWTKRLSHMAILAGFFGGFSAAMGVYVSSVVQHLPAGPAIVVIASSIVFCSFIGAPHRGIHV